MHPGMYSLIWLLGSLTGAGWIDGIGQLCGDREHVFGAKASTITMCWLVDARIDAARKSGIRAARAGGQNGSVCEPCVACQGVR